MLESKMFFCFRSPSEISQCGSRLPIWLRPPGPVCSELTGVEVHQPIVSALVITGNNRIIPDVSIEPFFQTC